MDLRLFVIDNIILKALQEDIGSGDLTSESIIPPDYKAKGIIHAKEKGIVAGGLIANRVFELINEQMEFSLHKKDGDNLEPGDIIAEIKGPARDILSGERVALNFMQRMSGIATRTRGMATLLEGTGAVVADTRKTTPGLRVLEKYAVRVGGGSNHRFGLYDGVLIKDNHIKVAGGIKEAVSKARSNAPHTIKIEVEVEDMSGVKEALEAGADIIMLDNMDVEAIKEAVALINKRALVELSGGITEKSLATVAALGVDVISVGALTHSVKALDLSLDIGAIKKGK